MNFLNANDPPQAINEINIKNSPMKSNIALKKEICNLIKNFFNGISSVPSTAFPLNNLKKLTMVFFIVLKTNTASWMYGQIKTNIRNKTVGINVKIKSILIRIGKTIIIIKRSQKTLSFKIGFCNLTI